MVLKTTDFFGDDAEQSASLKTMKITVLKDMRVEGKVVLAGKTVEIVAFDTKGNKATKSLFLERGAVQGATGPVFALLNPSGKRVKPNKDALALIIGVADYERTPAKAAYADKDAKTFYDYAMLKLGIPAGNITELVK